jgi:hypothetical protein
MEGVWEMMRFGDCGMRVFKGFFRLRRSLSSFVN